MKLRARNKLQRLAEVHTLARVHNLDNKKVTEQLSKLSKDTARIYRYSNTPLKRLIENACHFTYVAGYTDCEYEAGRALKSLK